MVEYDLANADDRERLCNTINTEIASASAKYTSGKRTAADVKTWTIHLQFDPDDKTKLERLVGQTCNCVVDRTAHGDGQWAIRPDDLPQN